MFKIAILVNDVSADVHDPSATDVLTQSREIAAALSRLGHRPTVVTCTLNLDDVQSQLRDLRPDLVFNLVESLAGTDRLMAAAPLLLDAMNLPFTGTGTAAILRSGDKVQAKICMATAGIPTPPWFDTRSRRWRHREGLRDVALPQTVIIKATYEHASFAMENGAVFAYHSDAHVEQALDQQIRLTGREHLAEQFVTGREFNLSVLETDGRPHVLPPAEIDFSELPKDLPRIVGARAKWVEDSVEYRRTPRRFDFSATDQPLLQRLRELTIECWWLFGLSGYGRVDFRVDELGNPYVLEVNANPCLSQDAGFVAAAAQSGIAYDDVIESILSACDQAPSAGLRGIPRRQLCAAPLSTY